jgi:uncharacterized RDD family membrane protein YckC
MNTIVIPTTQNIELEYPIANVGDRILATLLDWLVMSAYWGLLYLIFEITAFPPFLTPLFPQLVTPVDQLAYLPILVYPLVSEILLSGQSLGKIALKIRVVRLDGQPPDISDYFTRWLFRILDIIIIPAIPGIIAIISTAVTKNGQRLGDLAAHTTVIKLKLVTHFADTIFVDTHDTYQVQFPEISRLSDRDVSILKEVLDAGLRSNNPDLLLKLSNKVKEVAGIESRLSPREFLQTVLADYNHIFGLEAVNRRKGG